MNKRYQTITKHNQPMHQSNKNHYQYIRNHFNLRNFRYRILIHIHTIMGKKYRQSCYLINSKEE